MQRFLLGTNWKMHKNFSEALDYRKTENIGGGLPGISIFYNSSRTLSPGAWKTNGGQSGSVRGAKYALAR